MRKQHHPPGSSGWWPSSRRCSAWSWWRSGGRRAASRVPSALCSPQCWRSPPIPQRPTQRRRTRLRLGLPSPLRARDDRWPAPPPSGKHRPGDERASRGRREARPQGPAACAKLDLELVAATQGGWWCVGGPRKDVPLPAGRCRCKACPALDTRGPSVRRTGPVRCPESVPGRLRCSLFRRAPYPGVWHREGQCGPPFSPEAAGRSRSAGTAGCLFVRCCVSGRAAGDGRSGAACSRAARRDARTLRRTGETRPPTLFPERGRTA